MNCDLDGELSQWHLFHISYICEYDFVKANKNKNNIQIIPMNASN